MSDETFIDDDHKAVFVAERFDRWPARVDFYYRGADGRWWSNDCAGAEDREDAGRVIDEWRAEIDADK